MTEELLEKPKQQSDTSRGYEELKPQLEVEDNPSEEDDNSKRGVAKLALLALGVVFGDIGTSPLYAFRESFEHKVALLNGNIYGVLSLITWSLIIVVCIKYLSLVLRASHRGEGGILVLTALVSEHKASKWLLLLGLFGTALLYGDGILTPAISVLSAVEGLHFATHVFDPYIVPITIAILLALFSFQRHGTGTVGKVFGPVVLLWFIALGVLGVVNIAREPLILRAFNPYYAWHFFSKNGFDGLWVLGSVFLVVTGGEALYADLGHFGRKPIQWAWFSIVLPGLLLNYFGQGALLVSRPDALENPFFLMAPKWAVYPLVGLATMATVIASQALISGAFSLTAQAVQMGYLPRIKVIHTSTEEEGQVYVPAINLFLAIGCVAVVLGFRTASALAAAYGVAVTVTMVVTTVLLFFLARSAWNWSTWKAGLVCGFFLTVDLAFFVGNVNKIPQGGWFPLVVASGVFLIVTTWRAGVSKLAVALDRMDRDWETFGEESRFEERARAPGVAVYLASDLDHVPTSLISSWRHFDTLHEVVVLLTVHTTELPYLRGLKRLEIETDVLGFHRVKLNFGFREIPNVPKYLEKAGHRLGVDMSDCLYLLSRNELIRTKSQSWSNWRARLFQFLSRNSAAVREVFRLPSERVVELGLVLEID